MVDGLRSGGSGTRVDAVKPKFFRYSHGLFGDNVDQPAMANIGQPELGPVQLVSPERRYGQSRGGKRFRASDVKPAVALEGLSDHLRQFSLTGFELKVGMCASGITAEELVQGRDCSA